MGINKTLIASLKEQAGTLFAHKRLIAAARVCRQLCQLSPEDRDNWVMLGQTLRRLHNFDEAEQCCHRALALQPDYPPAHLALGATLQQQGRMEPALACYRAAIHANPVFAEAHYYHGNALRETGDLQGASTAYQRVLQLKPDHFECLNNFGILLINFGNGKEALTHLQHALSLQPDNVVTLTNLGDACVAVSRYEEAIRYLQHALRIDPAFANAHRALASALHHAGKMQEALESYEKLAELQPDSADAALGQAKILEQLGRYQESYRLLRPLLETGHKDVAPVFFDISGHVGRREEAVAGLEDMLNRRVMHHEAEASIHFKLGKHYDEVEDYDRAFHHYERGNALIPSQFNREKLVRFIDDSIAIYSPSFVQVMPRAANTSRLPVFIVGMPRSGTSLLEQILASHPSVYGAGELPHIGRIAQRLSNESRGQGFPLCVPRLTQRMLDSSAASHLRELRKLGGQSARVTDKMPYNFHHLGLILQLFPGASVIHCIRHPLDTCLSCFFANFGTVGHDFSYNLQTVGEFYVQYQRLMNHWESVFPDRIQRVYYQQLVIEQEETSRQLIRFCGLNWDNRCLDFHKTNRFVFTLSYEQVRQPIYNQSLDRWKHYEKHLEPLRKLLEAGGINCSWP